MLLALLASFALAQTPAKSAVTLGVDVLLGEKIELVKGKRVGLITNPSGVDGRLVATADRFARDGRFQLVRLFGPEHGIRGDAAAGDSVADAVDAKTGVPIESLYGKSRRPSAKSLAQLDVVVFDIQDVGSRTYTYISTLGEALKACAEAKKPVIVLDRPNPLGGLRFDGPVMTPEHQSFVGWSAMPVTHGLTIGEVARFYKSSLGLDVELEVVAMRGWKRSMDWADTGLTFVPTSPHIPRELSAELYVCAGMVASSVANVNDGVGSTLPFELIGAEFVDGDALAKELSSRALPGLRFRAHAWKPFYGKFQDKSLHGVQLVLDDPHALEPVRTAIEILVALEKLYGDRLVFEDAATVAKFWGDERLRELVLAKKSAAEIAASERPALAEFAKARAAALIYRE